jgi:hypothetical protein
MVRARRRMSRAKRLMQSSASGMVVLAPTPSRPKPVFLTRRFLLSKAQSVPEKDPTAARDEKWKELVESGVNSKLLKEFCTFYCVTQVEIIACFLILASSHVAYEDMVYIEEKLMGDCRKYIDDFNLTKKEIQGLISYERIRHNTAKLAASMAGAYLAAEDDELLRVVFTCLDKGQGIHGRGSLLTAIFLSDVLTSDSDKDAFMKVYNSVD